MDEDVFDPVTPQQRQGSWIDRPGIRSALLQAGLQMLMPTAPGASTAGNIASAIGSGGEAFRRSVGTNIAGRKQKADEVNTESLVNYRDDNNAPGGKAGGQLTLSQRMSAQKAAKKEWGDFLGSEAENLVATNPAQFPDENAAREFLTSDQNKANTIAKFKKGQQLAQEATGQQTLRTSGDLQAARPELFAQLKQGLLSGDEDATQAYAVLRARVADPEALDALLGVSGGN